MNRAPDVEFVLRAYLADTDDRAPDRVLDDVAARIRREPQRRSWRLPGRLYMNGYTKLAAVAAAAIVVAIVGWQLLPSGQDGVGASTPVPTVRPTATPTPTVSSRPSTPGGTPTEPGSFGGTVDWRDNGAPVTTEVDAIADGATVTGTAVHRFLAGTHTVRLGCAARDGDTWALAGKVETSTIPGEKAGFWSRVIVKDGSPQRVSIWLSTDAAPGGIECPDFLATFGFADLGPENFAPVESGELLPPADLAP